MRTMFQTFKVFSGSRALGLSAPNGHPHAKPLKDLLSYLSICRPEVYRSLRDGHPYKPFRFLQVYA